MVPPCSRLRIGLTGGIGSGKSTVAVLLQAHGATVVDTDGIARELSAPGGKAIEAIRREFGDEAIDASGALDRARMRTLAFSDTGARHRLESILHPMISLETELRATSASSAVVVFDVPLLAESLHWRSKVDKVLVVDCTEMTQVSRVMARSGWAEDAVRAVIALQASRQMRRACADAVIFNDETSLDGLSRQVQALARHWFHSVA